MIHDNYVHDLENDQCRLPPSELGHIDDGSEGEGGEDGAGGGGGGGGVSDFYEVAPPVYGFNDRAAEAIHATETMRNRSGT